MSTLKKIEQVPACYGEGFEENFWFSSITSEHSSVFEENGKTTKQFKDYMECCFMVDNMIKTKFCTSKCTNKSSQLSTASERNSPTQNK